MERSISPPATGCCAASTLRAGFAPISTLRATDPAPATNAAMPTSSRRWNLSMPEITRRKMIAMTAAATISTYPIPDPHVHVWSHDPHFPFAPGAKVPDYDATPEMLLGLMKANGVQKTVIIQ